MEKEQPIKITVLVLRSSLVLINPAKNVIRKSLKQEESNEKKGETRLKLNLKFKPVRRGSVVANRKSVAPNHKLEGEHVYIALEEANMIWSTREVELFDKFYKKGSTIYELSERFKRPCDDIVLLALDRAQQGFIKRRTGGLFRGVKS